MDITISDKYTDETHVFGIALVRIDGMDEQGRTLGAADRSGQRRIHRQSMTSQQAVDWIKAAADDGMKMEGFRIVALPKQPWEIAEAGERSTAEVAEPDDDEYQPGYEED